MSIPDSISWLFYSAMATAFGMQVIQISVLLTDIFSFFSFRKQQSRIKRTIAIVIKGNHHSFYLTYVDIYKIQIKIETTVTPVSRLKRSSDSVNNGG